MKGFRSIFIALVIVAVFCCTGTLLAQTVQGVVTGTVVDSSGAVIPNCDLKLTNDGTAVSQTEKSRPDGSFRFPLVPPGT